MKVKEMIKLLSEYNQEADVMVIDNYSVGHNINYYGFDAGDGGTMEHCYSVDFIFSDSKCKEETK